MRSSQDRRCGFDSRLSLFGLRTANYSPNRATIFQIVNIKRSPYARVVEWQTQRTQTPPRKHASSTLALGTFPPKPLVDEARAFNPDKTARYRTAGPSWLCS